MKRLPFVLPRPFQPDKEVVMVLAFGKLSVLEACIGLRESIARVEYLSDRVAVLRLRNAAPGRLQKLAGVHKFGPLLAVVDADGNGVKNLTDVFAENMDAVRKLSVSGYELGEDDYEAVVRLVLDGMKDSGFSKIRLLRPSGNELLSDEVASRQAVDIMAFRYHESIGLGPTSWVPETTEMRRRGTGKPSPRPEVAMSPRLAKVLLNLAGLQGGQTVLDPFCGSGTILTEALLGGYRPIGFDADPRRVEEARRNLEWLTGGIGRRRYELGVGDARRLKHLLDRGRVDAVVTEPLLLPNFQGRPSTRTATELVGQIEAVYSDALESMAEVLVPEGRVVVVVPVIQTIEGDEVSIRLDGRPLGLREFQPGPVGFEYPVRPAFETTRWVRRAVYLYQSSP